MESGLKQYGLTLRHFPQSFEHSTLGGWIATRSGGHFATLYTHIDDLVENISMVSPNGKMNSLRVPGSGAGPSPDRFMIGSEGSMGLKKNQNSKRLLDIFILIFYLQLKLLNQFLKQVFIQLM